MKFRELRVGGVAPPLPRHLCKLFKVNIFFPNEQNITFLYRQRCLFFFLQSFHLCWEQEKKKKKESDRENVYFFWEPRSVIESTFVRLIPRLFESVEVTGNLYTL